MRWYTFIMLASLLVLYAEAWYEALSARKAAIRAGEKRLHPADIGLISGLVFLPFGLVVMFFA